MEASQSIEISWHGKKSVGHVEIYYNTSAYISSGEQIKE